MNWRETQSDALEYQAAEIGAALEQLVIVLEILEHHERDDACRELRAACSMLRAERAGLEHLAGALKALRGTTPFPMTITTWHPRREALTE